MSLSFAELPMYKGEPSPKTRAARQRSRIMRREAYQPTEYDFHAGAFTDYLGIVSRKLRRVIRNAGRVARQSSDEKLADVIPLRLTKETKIAMLPAYEQSPRNEVNELHASASRQGAVVLHLVDQQPIAREPQQESGYDWITDEIRMNFLTELGRI